LNNRVLQTFAPTDPATGDVDQVLYTPSSGTPAPFLITMLPLDPVRLEGINPGAFTLRWAQLADFEEQEYEPQQGDMLTIDGANYMVEQVQNDLGGGLKFMLNRSTS
jgi:hypothetical protein